MGHCGRAKKQTPGRRARGSFSIAFKLLKKDALKAAFTLGFLARQFTGTTNGFSFLARFLDGRLLEMLLELHFAEYAFTLQLFLQSPKGLIDIVVTNTNLHVVFTTFLSLSCKNLQEVAV
jgi:hypothetical protein